EPDADAAVGVEGDPGDAIDVRFTEGRARARGAPDGDGVQRLAQLPTRGLGLGEEVFARDPGDDGEAGRLFGGGALEDVAVGVGEVERAERDGAGGLALDDVDHQGRRQLAA